MSSLRTEFRDSYLTLVSAPLLECCCLVTACCTERVTSTVYHPNFFFKIAHCSPSKISLPHTHGARRATAPSVLPPWSKSRLSRPQYPCLSSSLVPAEVTHSWVTVSVDSTSVFVWWLSALPQEPAVPFCQTVS